MEEGGKWYQTSVHGLATGRREEVEAGERERTLSYAPPREACGFCVNWRFAAFILVAEFDRAPSLPVLPLLWPFGGIFVAATEKIAQSQGDVMERGGPGAWESGANSLRPAGMISQTFLLRSLL